MLFFPPSVDWLGQEFSLSYAQLSLPQGLDVQQMSTVADLQLCTSIKVLRGKSCHLGTKPSRGLEVPKEALSPIWTNGGTTVLPLWCDNSIYETRTNYCSLLLDVFGKFASKMASVVKDVSYLYIVWVISTSFMIEYHSSQLAKFGANPSPNLHLSTTTVRIVTFWGKFRNIERFCTLAACL